jgi:predicted SnoaL-like aldol condensation-catalyzing enzyme
MENNKEIVKKVLDTAFNKKDAQTASQMLTDRYIQHNPLVPTGKEGFVQGITGFLKMFPDAKWTPKKVWAEGDYVIVHSHYQFVKEGKGNAIVDIFRFKDGKIDEHWDVSQEIPHKMAHNNGMF